MVRYLPKISNYFVTVQISLFRQLGSWSLCWFKCRLSFMISSFLNRNFLNFILWYIYPYLPWPRASGWKLPQGAYFPTHPSSRQCIIATSREWVSWLRRRLAIRLNQPWWKLLMFYCWCYKVCYCWVVVVEMMMLVMLLTATQSIRVTADGSWRLVGISTFSTFTSCPAAPPFSSICTPRFLSI